MNRLYAISLFAVLTMALAAMMLSQAMPGAADDNGELAFSPAQAEKREDNAFYAVDVSKIERDRTGQFRLNGVANGQDVEFLVDTGADVVALTVETAQDIGIDVNSDTFGPIAQTAAGTGYGAMVKIDRLEVAGTELDNVEAMVVEKLDINLLGQSALRKLGKVQLRGDTMTIQPE